MCGRGAADWDNKEMFEGLKEDEVTIFKSLRYGYKDPTGTHGINKTPIAAYVYSTLKPSGVQKIFSTIEEDEKDGKTVCSYLHIFPKPLIATVAACAAYVAKQQAEELTRCVRRTI